MSRNFRSLFATYAFTSHGLHGLCASCTWHLSYQRLITYLCLTVHQTGLVHTVVRERRGQLLQLFDPHSWKVARGNYYFSDWYHGRSNQRERRSNLTWQPKIVSKNVYNLLFDSFSIDVTYNNRINFERRRVL